MIKIIMMFFSFFMLLNASVLDDYYIVKAKLALENKEYNKANSYYEKIENKTDTIYYNMGTILSHQKNFHGAIEYYKKVQNKDIKHKALFNMANSYVALYEYEKAIELFKKSLELSKDVKVQFNLDMALLEQIKHRESQTLTKMDKKFRKGRANEGIADLLDGDISELNVTLYENELDENRSLFSGLSNNKFENTLGIKIEENLSEDNSSKTDFSNYVQDKWENKFDIKVHTLLIPLSKGEVNDSKKPW
jgi:tetratricopeptide (TPR) repeat protein